MFSWWLISASACFNISRNAEILYCYLKFVCVAHLSTLHTYDIFNILVMPLGSHLVILDCKVLGHTACVSLICQKNLPFWRWKKKKLELFSMLRHCLNTETCLWCTHEHWNRGSSRDAETCVMAWKRVDLLTETFCVYISTLNFFATPATLMGQLMGAQQ